jgi:hypothetical protein
MLKGSNNAATLGIPTCSVSSSFYCPAAAMTYSAITTGSFPP